MTINFVHIFDYVSFFRLVSQKLFIICVKIKQAGNEEKTFAYPCKIYCWA
jgi:hypothetical protein